MQADEGNRQQRADGEGQGLTIIFTDGDPQDLKAQTMSKRLAGMGRGVRKRAIVALLAAMETRYQRTGVVTSAVEIDDVISKL